MSITKITVHYAGEDGVDDTRTFATLKSARNFAQSQIGERPRFFGPQACSADGDGMVRVTGITLAELFPATVNTSAPLNVRH